MARCDQGYLCQICGEEVDGLAESDLYLRYILGEVDPERLHMEPERHIRCNPSLAQFIVSDDFEVVRLDGPFGKGNLDRSFVTIEEQRVTAAYHRLRQIQGSGDVRSILEYVPESLAQRWR
jgi:hypothetical protein